MAGLAALTLLVAGCGPATDEAALDNLQLVGVDFELNSMIITNNGASEVLTDGLWAYRDGEAFEFDLFPIEPRATILFSMRDLGDIDVGGGEIALADGDDFSDPDALLQYVAWGSGGSDLSSLATDAGLWPEAETIETHDDTLILIRTDPTGSGPDFWQASDEVG